jgi:hypothetical protein
METARFSETLAYTNQSTWCFRPKEHQNCHRSENLKSHKARESEGQHTGFALHYSFPFMWYYTIQQVSVPSGCLGSLLVELGANDFAFSITDLILHVNSTPGS